MLVFIADKLAWDQPGEPPYLSQLQAGLAISLQKAAAAFLMHLWEQRAHLPVWHPWTEAACRDLFEME
jgi:HD superfamily phosphohydrolase YqeK